MGKTKLNKISNETTEKLSGKAAYEKKQAKKAEKEQNLVQVQVQVEVQDQVPHSAEATRGEQVQVKKEVKLSQPASGRGKAYLAARAKVDPTKSYSLTEAAKLVKEVSYSKFPGSIELHLMLSKDSLNTRVELPYSTGSTKKVEVAGDETVKKLQSGKIDFDVLLASPQTMAKLVPFAKLLGPRGLMPNPKNGTLVENPEKAVEKFSGNAVSVRTEKAAPLVHIAIAKVSQPEAEIEANIKAVFAGVDPSFIKKAVIAPSMGPSIRLTI